jgi:hypothetical protein
MSPKPNRDKLGPEFDALLEEHTERMLADGFIIQAAVCLSALNAIMVFVGPPGGIARERFLKLLALADADYYAHQMLKD